MDRILDDRTRISCQVWGIAEQYNISISVAKEIINSYLNHCKVSLVNGECVDFFGIVRIVPDRIQTDYSSTLGYECLKVANSLSMPYYTVYAVIKAYLNDLLDNILNGRVAEVRGLVTVKPLLVDGKLTTVHSHISQSLKEVLQRSTSPVSSVRVHTYKSLRDRMGLSNP